MRKTATNSVGRPRKYSPDMLSKKIEEYKHWVETNPIPVDTLSCGRPVTIHVARPMTVVGFCVFAGINRDTLHNYGLQPEYSDIVTHVREVVESDQLAGAMAGIYNSNIVARTLYLAIRRYIMTKSRPLMSAQPITIKLDKDAARIIHSIKM